MIPLFVDKKEVIELVRMSSRMIDYMEAAGRFPTRVRVGGRKVVWRYTDIVQWADSLAA